MLAEWLWNNRRWLIPLGVFGVVFLILFTIAYFQVRVDVPAGHIAVKTKKTGTDLSNEQIVAPDEEHKGLQLDVLTEGRHFLNPYTWDVSVYPMITIPEGKLGVRVRLYGENLPYGHFLATKENQKGIVPEVLRPGRYAINGVIKGQEKSRPRGDYVEVIELYDPITIQAGFRGVVTNLAGDIPENPNTILVEAGKRGVQKETLDAGTYYLNPYVNRVNVVDCRSQRFNLAQNYDMGFPSKDGFWVSLDGIIEFKIDPKRAAEVFVIYNESQNDKDGQPSEIHDEIVRKIIMPNARAFCRLRGSNQSGRDFIGGETRGAFQKEFNTAMHKSCDANGVQIVQALITSINPPQAIAKPVRDREVARQKQLQYGEQKQQQESEAKLATEKALIDQRQELVNADQKVVQDTTVAKQQQEVAVTKAKQDLAVAKLNLEATKDQAAAILAKKKAEAGIIDLQNKAEAAGWAKAVEAFGGNGEAYAQYVLYQKLAPAFKEMMLNTADSPLMKIFEGFRQNNPSNPNAPPPPKKSDPVGLPAPAVRPEDKK